MFKGFVWAARLWQISVAGSKLLKDNWDILGYKLFVLLSNRELDENINIQQLVSLA